MFRPQISVVDDLKEFLAEYVEVPETLPSSSSEGVQNLLSAIRLDERDFRDCNPPNRHLVYD